MSEGTEDAARGLILDDDAIAVSAITGIPWRYERVETRQPERPCINMNRLDWPDKWRVAWTVIGTHYFFVRCDGGTKWTS